ncbi:MAG: helix-turn-helix domain-containing protein [Alphaproteobacteria bacterium]|nr:helix-turn-helix domain-containing protein [Alphaproteobacteria bacterium]
MNENIENNEEVQVPVELTAGEILRNARTTGRRKREISTVAKQLCIREEFLNALEEGNYTFIPETVYILGFARNYAMELGLNPDEIVEKIKKEMGLIPGACSASGDGADDEGPTCARPSLKEENPAKAFFVRVYQFIYQNWIWFAGALALIVLAIVLVFALGGDDKADVENTVPVVEVVAKVNEPEFKTVVRERFGTENREKANVILQAAQESWVKVEDGRGNTVFSRVLVAGDVYYVPVGEKYKATFGNAGGVDVWVNGKLIPDIGKDGERKSGILLSPDSLISSKK